MFPGNAMNQTTQIAGAIPPLYHGDRLPIDEFERRRDAMPGSQKIELLDGMVYLQYDTGRVLNRKIPPLANGDYLSVEEFERRWDNMPDVGGLSFSRCSVGEIALAST